MKLFLVSLCLTIYCFAHQVTCQFPSICNSQPNLDTKVCCPNNCGGSDRGMCTNIRADVVAQANRANTEIIEILRTAPSTSQKGKVDARYLWPIMVFDHVCVCKGNYYGADCSECAFGWTGTSCQTRKQRVVRKSFSKLSDSEKNSVFKGLHMLKNNKNWSVIISEPTTTADKVAFQDVSTYDYLAYIHNYAARDSSAACTAVNNGSMVDFAHSGPCFPVWHRLFLLILERAMQKSLNNENFGFPYWSWESYDRSPFSGQYFGSFSSMRKNFQVLSDGLARNWSTVCDAAYQNGVDNYFGNNNTELCENIYWPVCNPQSDTANNNRLERGNAETYLPAQREIQIAIAAPEYDRANSIGLYQRDSPRESFRTRLEGWSIMCSADNCVGPQVSNTYQRVHNNVHDWVGGHMAIAAASVNDPIFSLHHANVDRILESWMKRFGTLPPYMPENNGHPGHNKDDYMVPFFPLVTPGQQYQLASEFGYEYDHLFSSTINDNDLSTCPIYDNSNISLCYICTPVHSDCLCYQSTSNAYERCPECPASSKNRCASGSSITLQTYFFVLSILMVGAFFNF